MTNYDPQSENTTDLAIRGLQISQVWDYENAFYWFSHPSRLNKMLAHYELYKSIVGLPGDVIELGVYKATSLIRLATFRMLLENEFSRKIVGFDAFGKFPTDSLSMKEDLEFVNDFEATGGEGLSVHETSDIFERKSFRNVHLNAGNVFETVPAYLEKHPETRIAFLHLDLDVKEPTAFALNALYDRVVPGGVIVLDDYNTEVGGTAAIDEFIAERKLRIEKTNHYIVPSYIRKP